MTRLSDAAAINAAAGPHWDSIQPDPDYPCCEHCLNCPGGHSQPCNGCAQAVRDSADRRAARAMNEAGAVNLGALTATFLLAVLIVCLGALFVMGGERVMCATHRADGHGALEYCHDFPAVRR